MGIFPIIIGWYVQNIIEVSTQQWDYNDFRNWPEKCQTGKFQSPIAINTKTLVPVNLPPIVFSSYDTPHAINLQNKDRTVKIKFRDTNFFPITIRGGILISDYVLDHIHFHWDSEHTINNKRFPYEAHFVHYLKEAENVTNAFSFDNGIVVMGVLYELTADDSKIFDVISQNIQPIASKPIVYKLDEPFTPQSLLPTNLAKYFTYRGSLTTPNCNEVVQWIVFEQTSLITENQLKNLVNIIDEENKPITRNYRQTQPLWDRNVLYSIGG